MKKKLLFSTAALSMLFLSLPSSAEGNTATSTAKVGWQLENKKWYYFDEAGSMLANTIFDGYLFNKAGAMVENAWELINNQWYYAKNSGKHLQSQWERINGKWYYFDGTGAMIANTIFDGYLFNKDGAMVENAWELINNQWYYAKNSGKYLQSQWERINGKWYYFDGTGAMIANTIFDGYLFNKDGAMAENTWELINNQWYYAKNSGKYLQSQWERINEKWYYFNQSGIMLANKWQESYYLKDSGAMAEKEWIFDPTYNSHFYLKANGMYAANEWVEDSYLKTGGYMAKNEWIEDSWLDENGKITRKSWVDNNQYYLTANGKKFKYVNQLDKTKENWIKIDNEWYYNKKGVPASNEWAGNYWLGEDGRMLTNSWVDNDRYYVGNDGAWVQNRSTAVLQIANSYVGTVTGSEEHKKIVDAYNAVLPRPLGYKANYRDDWCDIFISVIFQEAGLSDLVGRECGVQRHISIMKEKGIWLGKTQPKVGDIIAFDFDGGGFADHIGIVESVKDGKITTIEGNAALTNSASEVTKVHRKTYDWNARSIMGYGRPQY